MLIKRHHLTLIELITSFSLITILTSSLLCFHLFISKTHQNFQSIEKKSKEICYAQLRLSDIFDSIKHFSMLNKNQEKNYFFTDDNGLVFTYNNNVDTQALFMDKVLAKLYLDDNTLCLVTWPLSSQKDNIPIKKEILLNDVENLSFSFFAPKNESNEESPFGELTEWKKCYSKLPLIIEIKVYLQKKAHNFDFELQKKVHKWKYPH